MKVIFSTDDMGLTYGITDAVRDTFKYGLTTSTSVMVNGKAFDYAVKIIKKEIPSIGIGLHLNLTDGPSFEPGLADENGNYNNTFLSLLKKTSRPRPDFLKMIVRDFDSQMKKALDSGLKVDYINSDKQIHMIPAVFEAAAKICRKYKIRYIRVSREHFLITNPLKKNIKPFLNTNILKYLVVRQFAPENLEIAKSYGLKSSDSFYGVLYTNIKEPSIIISDLKDAMKRRFEVVEILGHPGYIKDPRDTEFISPLMEKYSQSIQREKEALCFKDKGVLDFCRSNGIEKISFRDLE